jgi:hypothetical protein
MENLIVSLSNLYAVIPITRLIAYEEYFGAFIVSMAMISSTAYHMVETNKHHMMGMGKYYGEQILLNLDRFFAIISTLYIIVHFPIGLTSGQFIGFAICGSIALGVSEIPHYVKQFEMNYPYGMHLYVVSHIIWHITAFHCADLLISNNQTI